MAEKFKISFLDWARQIGAADGIPPFKRGQKVQEISGEKKKSKLLDFSSLGVLVGANAEYPFICSQNIEIFSFFQFLSFLVVLKRSVQVV